MNENQKKTTDGYRDSYDRIFGKKEIKTTPAAGTKGILIRSLGDKVYFRVYQENGDFVDYDIYHHDLSITIDDDGAVFCEQDGKHFIDYDSYL